MFYENQKRKDMRKMAMGDEVQPNNLNFDQSERFDESMMSRDLMGIGMASGMIPGEPMDIMGVSINSQSMDQSLIDQSMNSRIKRKKLKKQKEDLDGSRLFRDGEDDEESIDPRASKGKKVKKEEKKIRESLKKKNSPLKNNFLKQAKK